MSDKATVLFVDDEERILRSLKMLFRSQYRVVTTIDGNEALDVLRRERVDVIVSDQRMPKMTGVELLRAAKELSPRSMRILLTGYSDLAAIVGSVNDGEIYRYISKPWTAEEIKRIVAEAAEIAEGMGTLAADEEEVDAARPSVLVIDSDETVYHKVREAAEAYPVHWSRDMESAFDVLERERIGIVLADIRDNGEDRSDALKSLKRFDPTLVTMVMTRYTDAGAIVGLINEGQVYRYHPKPPRVGLLARSIDAAAAHHQQLKAQPQLQRRHRVETKRDVEKMNLSSKMLNYLRRLRTNAATA